MKVTAATILTIVLLASFYYKTVACRCDQPGTVKMEVKYADAVIVGKALNQRNIVLIDSTTKTLSADDEHTLVKPFYSVYSQYTFVVEDIYKGEFIKDTITICTGLNGAACGVNFILGDTYIIYGDNETYLSTLIGNFKYPEGKNIFWTNLCSRTTEYNEYEITEIEKYAKKRTLGKG